MWLASLIGARWFRYALAGMAVIASLIYVRGLIYQQGYAKASQECQQAQTEQAIAQVKKDRKQAQRDAQTVSKVSGTREGLKHEIQATPTPNLCNSDECLQQFNAPIEIINSHTE